MRLECYQNASLIEKIVEYETTIGQSFCRYELRYENSTPSEIITEIEQMLHYANVYGKDVCLSSDSDDEIRWRNKVDEYKAHFGDGLGLGYGAPESREECYAIMCDCIERGEPFDPYASAGIDEAERPYVLF